MTGTRQWVSNIGDISEVNYTLDVMALITRTDIEAKLRAWAAGQIEAAAVHEWAESHHSSEWERENESVNEVLGQLDMMDMNLMTPDDIPALLSALRANNAAEVLEKHASSIDFADRKKRLRTIPFYARFCR
jgi:hypothetical protein